MRKEILPLLIALILLVISLGAIIFTNYTIDISHYVGLTLTLVSTILFFTYKNIYRYVFGFTLVLATIGIVEFLFIGIGFEFGAFGASLKFMPVNLALLIWFLVLNKELIDQFSPESKKPALTKTVNQNKLETRIERFEQKFSEKSEYELNQILDVNNDYVDEARIAAERILKSKYKPQQRI